MKSQSNPFELPICSRYHKLLRLIKGAIAMMQPFPKLSNLYEHLIYHLYQLIEHDQHFPIYLL